MSGKKHVCALIAGAACTLVLAGGVGRQLAAGPSTDLLAGKRLSIQSTPSSSVGAVTEASLAADGHCVVDQDQPSGPNLMANFSQSDLAQSFKPTSPEIDGAAILLMVGVGTSDIVVISLWDALPNAGGNMLATGATVGTQGTWAEVFWQTVAVTPGLTYYLVFTGNTTLGIAGDETDPYPNGHVYANAGFQSYPDYDYTFRTCGVCPDATVTVEIYTDPYPSETTWELIEHGSAMVIASGGPYVDPNTLHATDVCVDSGGCYDFIIYDSYGDGLCCAYGDGYYKVRYEGVLAGSGGEFFYSDTVPNVGCSFIPWSFDNGLPLDDYGAPASQYDGFSPNVFSAEAADDFVLEGDGGSRRLITDVRFWVTYFNHSVVPDPAGQWTGVTVTLYGDSGLPGPSGHRQDDGSFTGAVVATQTVAMADVAVTPWATGCIPDGDTFQIDVPVDIEVEKYHPYWITFQPHMDFDDDPNGSPGYGQTMSVLSQTISSGPAQQIFPLLGTADWTEIVGNHGSCPATPPYGLCRNLAFRMFGIELSQLVATEPPADGSLPKTQSNLILCFFDGPITLPASGYPLIIKDMTNACVDVSASFEYSIDLDDPTGATLEAREVFAQLTDGHWYQVNSAPGWTSVVPFQFEVYTLVGDCNNSGRVTTADYSGVKATLGLRGDLREDLNGSARVTTADYSVVKANLGHRASAKPTLCP